jgi:hypothetical protein
VCYAFITFQPGVFLASTGVVLALLAQRAAEDTSYPESCATVILTAGLYVVSYVRSAGLMAAAYLGAREARLRLGLEMLTAGLLGVPALQSPLIVGRRQGLNSFRACETR